MKGTAKRLVILCRLCLCMIFLCLAFFGIRGLYGRLKIVELQGSYGRQVAGETGGGQESQPEIYTAKLGYSEGTLVVKDARYCYQRKGDVMTLYWPDGISCQILIHGNKGGQTAADGEVDGAYLSEKELFDLVFGNYSLYFNL